MSAPEPPEGRTPTDQPSPPSSSGGHDGTAPRTWEFHGEKLDFDPYRFGPPEPTAPTWSPPAPGETGAGQDDGPAAGPTPGQRWDPSAGAEPPPALRPGDYWNGAGSRPAGPGGPVFPPPGYVPPTGRPGDDGSTRVDLGKPADGSTSSDRPGASQGAGFQQAPPPPSAYAPQPYGQNPYGQNPYAPSPYPQSPGQTPGSRGNGIALAGFVVGLVSTVLFFLNWIAAVVGLVGLGLSIAGYVKARRGASRKGLATWGMVLSTIGIIAGIALLVFILSRLDLDCVERAGGDISAAQECVR